MNGNDIKAARSALGAMWRADKKPLTAKELARALKLSPQHGTDHIYNMESGRSAVSGPIEMCVRLYLGGSVPPDDVVIFGSDPPPKRGRPKSK